MLHLTPRIHRANWQIDLDAPQVAGIRGQHDIISYGCTRCHRGRIGMPRAAGAVFVPDPKARERWR